MDTLRYLLTACSGVLFFVAFVPYMVAIIRRTAEPVKVTWIIWASLDTITLAGMYFEHTINGQIIGAVLGAWVTVVLVLRFGKSGWTRNDKRCLGGAVLAVVLWKFFDNPTVGIVVSNAVVFLGSFMTFKSAWSEPEKEDKIAWAIWWISCVCAMCSLPSWQLADSAQPITFFAVETIMVWLLFVRRRNRKSLSINTLPIK